MERQKQRIELLDAARGAALLGMLLHHIFFDLVVFAGAPRGIFYNPVFSVLHYASAGAFIFISGVSSNLSRGNVRRGLKTLAVALVVTLVTTILDMPVVFGVLHFLGTCMLLYGLTQRFWRALDEKVPWLVPALALAGGLATLRLINGYPSTMEHLWIFGLVAPGFYSADYFPLLPWSFLFLLGAWTGKYAREERLPKRFYDAKLPFLSLLGRRSLLIYIVHQPVLYGAIMLIARGLRLRG